jgi:hypothetical protein
MTLFVLPEHSPMDESSYELMIRVDPSVHQHVAIGKPVKHTAIQRWIITGVISIGILVAFVIAHIVLLTLKA